MKKNRNYYNSLKKLVEDKSIWPFGEHGKFKVTAQKLHIEDYPDVVKVGSINSQLLYDDFKKIKKNIREHGRCSDDYSELIVPKMKQLGFDPKDALYALHLGKFGKKYGHYCHKLYCKSTLNDWMKFVPVTTISALDFLGEFYQQEYFVHNAGIYKTNWHIDYLNHFTHGYRVLIPISKPTYLCFKRNKKSKEQAFYKLDLNSAYFVNTGVLHRGFSFSNDFERVFLHVALNNDRLIVKGECLKETKEDIPKKYSKEPIVNKFWLLT